MKGLALFLLFAALGSPIVADTDTGNPTPPANRESKSAVQEVRNAFLPGFSASVLVPFRPGQVYWGGNFHYAFIEGISASATADDFGGYYEWYSEIGYYKEQGSNAYDNIFFTYSSGVNLSFEKFLTTYRDVLVPYFGAKLGGVYFNRASGGFYLEPVVGLVLFQTKVLNLNYDAGLFLSTVHLSDYIGVHHSLVLNVNL